MFVFFRLFSSAVMGNEFEEFSPPEITCRPIEEVYLQLKVSVLLCVNTQCALERLVSSTCAALGVLHAFLGTQYIVFVYKYL